MTEERCSVTGTLTAWPNLRLIQECAYAGGAHAGNAQRVYLDSTAPPEEERSDANVVALRPPGA